MNPEQKEVLKQEIALYKTLRAEIPTLIPFFPCGPIHFEDDFVVAGYRAESCTYLCVMRHEGQMDSVSLPFDSQTSCTRLYPPVSSATCHPEGDRWTITMPPHSSAVYRFPHDRV